MTMTGDEKKIKEITGGYVIGKLYEEIECSKGENVFDEVSYNFHLYPGKSNELLRSTISQEIKKKRNDVLNAICNLNLTDVEIEILENNNQLIKPDTIYVSKGEGSRGGNGDFGGLFKYIAAQKNGIKYELNFMRFFINNTNKEVNCILKAIQFDRCIGEFVNRSEGGCDICYPTCSYSHSDEELEKVLKRRNGKSFCYNPQIDFYDDAEKIAEEFIKFINKSNAYGKRSYIVKKEILSKICDNRHFLRFDRYSNCLEVYEKKNNNLIGDFYPIRQDFDSSEYVIYELKKTMPCIFGGYGNMQTPTGIFNIEKVSSSEYTSSYYPNFDKVKFFGYLVVFEDYFIHSDMYQIDATLNNFHAKEPISLHDKHTSGCIRVNQNDLDWLIKNISVGTTIEM